MLFWTIVKLALVIVLSAIVWRLFKRYIVARPMKDVPGPVSDSWWTGNLVAFFSPEAYDWHHNLVSQFGSCARFWGFFGDEQLYITDPKAMEFIMKSEVFDEQPYFLEGNNLWFGPGLLSTQGEMHRRQRKTVAPCFSPSQIKNLMPTAYAITHELANILTKQVENTGELQTDMHDWMSRSSLDYISKCGLGYSFDAFDDSKPNAYRDNVKNFIPTLVRTAIVRQAIPHVVQLGPTWFRRLLVKAVPLEHVQLLKRFSDILWSTSEEVLNNKQTNLAKGDAVMAEQIGQGKDVMSILLRSNSRAKDKLSQTELLGQISTLIFAAQDTSAAGMSRALQVLAHHPDVQRKLREEIVEARQAKGDLDYNDLMNLPLLDAVFRETMRMYPPVAFTLRTAREDSIVPLSRPVAGVSGNVLTEVFVPAGTDITIGIIGANKDPAIWGSDGDMWRPERWLEPLSDALTKSDLPGIYTNGIMTFGCGPRSCIGLKFSEMETKIILSVLLEKFDFTPPDKEIVWQLGNIQVPYLKGTEESLRPNLPLKLSLVEK